VRFSVFRFRRLAVVVLFLSQDLFPACEQLRELLRLRLFAAVRLAPGVMAHRNRLFLGAVGWGVGTIGLMHASADERVLFFTLARGWERHGCLLWSALLTYLEPCNNS
jgi:hypothetical protein